MSIRRGGSFDRRGGGFDRKAGRIEVDPVGNEMEPTRPDITFDVELRERTGEWDQRSQGAMSIRAEAIRYPPHGGVTRLRRSSPAPG